MRYTKAKEVALLGVLFALAMALSFMESALTPLLGLLPAMKLGLSNVVVMFALLFLPRRQALLLAVLKAVFALLTRGVTAGFLSLCGGGASFAVLCLLLAWPRPVTGFIFSVCGALAHNIGQLCGAAVLPLWAGRRFCPFGRRRGRRLKFRKTCPKSLKNYCGYSILYPEKI